MRKKLKETAATKKYLDSLPKMYLVVCWATWGVWEFPFSGKYIKDEDGVDIPLVYQFTDHNGAYSEWVLVPITDTTTGRISGWSQIENMANACATQYNLRDGFFAAAELGWGAIE